MSAPQTLTRVDGPALVAGLSVLLHRYTDRTELTVGWLDEGSAAAMPLALTLDEDATLAALSARVRDAISAGGASDAAAPDAVVAIGQAPPEGAAHPPWLRASGSGEELELFPNGSAGIAGIADELVIGHLRALLAAAAAEPDTPAAALPILSPAERHRLLVECNDTAADYPRACLPELIDGVVRSTPDAVAVAFGEESLSYAELDRRSNQLANHHVAHGVGPDVLVGIAVERSLEMVVGLLGILKAGGAYVPIDPAYPADRQAYMLENSQAPVVLTQSSLRDALPVGDATVVCIDSDWHEIATRAQSAPDVAMDPEQLAYVIYTSGSTGKPKGVQIPHRALVNFLVTMQRTPGLERADVLVAVTTLSFDIAGLELYLPLITGARVVIASAATSGDPRALASLLETSGATVMQATPTTWRMLVDAGWTPPTGGLKGLCGGEALPVALADAVAGLGVELWNMYGPTETTIWSTCARVLAGEPITIGRPIANTTLYVLDQHLQPVPVGVPGELWIGGDGLARGYRGRDDLTEERFLADPFRPGERMYRTGDLVRYRADANVEYIGRIDHQVKVRGFRIELGEIETVLTAHPAVGSAVVVARGSAADAELAAYVIPHGVPVAAHALRQYLTTKLPAYMVPSTVTTLDAFPLTPNGKVDRKALPEPTRERSGDHELVAPRTPLEERLAAIWERELGISPIGVTDNFFDLGVTSIVAATLFAAIEHALGDDLPLGAIFRAPTIESLATLIEAGEQESRWTSLIPIQPSGSEPPIFCVHGGAGTILHLAQLARHLGPDQPFYGLQSKGLYGGVASLKTVEEMASHYLSEMREVHPGGPWRIAGYCFGTIVAFELAQRLVAQGETVELVAMFNGPSPAWIKRWGWYGNQPSKRANRSPRVRLTRAQKLSRQAQRVARALREPRRLRSGLTWYVKEWTGAYHAKLALALGRPLPEALREQYFLRLHQVAERAYEPKPYSGRLLVFYGEGLYEDPGLGWTEFATGGIETHAVPGEHDNNRQAMMEPFVASVSDRITEYLQRA